MKSIMFKNSDHGAVKFYQLQPVNQQHLNTQNHDTQDFFHISSSIVYGLLSERVFL